MKKLISNLTLAIIPLLTGLSVYASFLGAERAQKLSNSTPLIFCWLFIEILIIASLFSSVKLHKPHLFLIHAGAILIFSGAMLSSEKAHEISRQMFKREKPVKNLMAIYEGQSSNQLYQPSNNSTFQLPFQIHLNDFIIENYTPYLIIQFPDGLTEKIPAQIDSELTLNDHITKIRIINLFENFRITLDNGERKAIDSKQPGRNPAVELEITRKDGRIDRQFVFELFNGHAHPANDLQFTYYRPVKDYISRVDVIKDGVIVKSADIEVNHPLHFSGFHFYQHSYDSEQYQYTVLQVVSDTGLNVVYVGYTVLCIGVIWYFWFIRLRQG